MILCVLIMVWKMFERENIGSQQNDTCQKIETCCFMTYELREYFLFV